jgi:hypothetical protein
VRRDGLGILESLAQLARWRAPHDAVWRDISGHDRTGSHDRSSPYTDSRQQYRPKTDPYIVFDYDFLSHRRAGADFASYRRGVADRVAHGAKIVVAPTYDGDSIGEQAKAANSTIRFDVDVLPYVHVIGKNYMQRSPESTTRTNMHIVSDG